MRCPYCGGNDDRVLDSRPSSAGAAVKRRRQCDICGRRYTTYERVAETGLYVIKNSDQRREPFDRTKILRGMQVACKGRPVSIETLETITDEIEKLLYNKSVPEVSSAEIGEMVMERLQSQDQVAYVRFASVYRRFEDATQFGELVKGLSSNDRPNSSSNKYEA